jgi:hypothetical protein
MPGSVEIEAGRTVCLLPVADSDGPAGADMRVGALEVGEMGGDSEMK